MSEPITGGGPDLDAITRYKEGVVGDALNKTALPDGDLDLARDLLKVYAEGVFDAIGAIRLAGAAYGVEEDPARVDEISEGYRWGL